MFHLLLKNTYFSFYSASNILHKNLLSRIMHISICSACDSTHFGHNCSSVCDCFVANSADCNDVDGQCLCNKGWTGPKCDRLIDQCTNASFCTAANEACYNISGVLSCDCATGFYKPSSGASCQGRTTMVCFLFNISKVTAYCLTARLSKAHIPYRRPLYAKGCLVKQTKVIFFGELKKWLA